VAAAKYPNDEEPLRKSGVIAVLNIYTEAGTKFADFAQIENEA